MKSSLHLTCAVLTIAFACLGISCKPQSKTHTQPQQKSTITSIPTIMKTNEEWKQLLSPTAYHILREHGTERPFGPDYKKFKETAQGSFHCAGCDLPLFSSKTSFDSRSGWPSFWEPVKDENVTLIEDTSLGMKRVEVRCARCDGHLGHVFEGEKYGNPVDLRYCINAGALTHSLEEQEN